MTPTTSLARDQRLGSAAGSDDRARHDRVLETAVFLLLIVPSMALSFFAVQQGQLPFVLVAVATISRDAGLVALIFYFLHRNAERPSLIGWTDRHAAREAALGACLFVPLFIGAQILESFLRAAGLSSPSSPVPDLVPLPDFVELAVAVLLVVVVAISEEVIFRGYMVTRFSQLFGSYGPAVFMSAFVFSLGHGYEGTAGVVTVGVTGLVFGFVYLRRKSLVAPMVMHFLLDFVAIVLVPLAR